MYWLSPGLLALFVVRAGVEDVGSATSAATVWQDIVAISHTQHSRWTRACNAGTLSLRILSHHTDDVTPCDVHVSFPWWYAHQTLKLSWTNRNFDHINGRADKHKTTDGDLARLMT